MLATAAVPEIPLFPGVWGGSAHRSWQREELRSSHTPDRPRSDAEERLPPAELLTKGGEGCFPRSVAATMLDSVVKTTTDSVTGRRVGG
jgi:hypothetical protein